MRRILDNLRLSGWNKYIDVLLLTGNANKVNNVFSGFLEDKNVYRDLAIGWKCLYKNKNNIDPCLSNFSSIRNVSFIDLAKIEYAKSIKMPITNLYDQEFHRNSLDNYYTKIKEKYGENYWLEMAICNIDFNIDVYQYMFGNPRSLLIIKDWKYLNELEYMINLKKNGIIGGLYTARIFRNINIEQNKSFLNNITTDCVIFNNINNDPYLINDTINKVKLRYPQYHDYNDIEDII